MWLKSWLGPVVSGCCQAWWQNSLGAFVWLWGEGNLPIPHYGPEATGLRDQQ